ncbi:carbohydrate ABC transporter permease [Paenibacillus donghaensis]|uniref:carbohydrate ABC transporter permease n=1 Tax=Paenibacillus donghaensis TaxID=414771 RepID=UPI001D15EBAA|nr:carbohydrate ABC transporter permease [Paenibacillus donghaensis]MBE9917568.1 carbohydrate ABC transporter permease [Paenibacillus donghaensis]
MVERAAETLHKTKMKEAGSDRLFTIVNYTVLTLIMIIVLYPLVYVVSASFSSSSAVLSGRVWLWPVEPTLDGYRAVFKNGMVVRGFMNTLFYTLAGTGINLLFTVLAAYPLSRKDFRGRNIFMLLFVFTMMFNGGLIPTYLLVKNLGMIDTVWSMLIPAALSVWNVIIMRTYFQTTIPGELLEASQLDGCTDFRFLLRIVLPLSGPILAVIALFYAVGHWNQYFNAMIFLKRAELYPLQLILRDILVQNEVNIDMLGDAKTAAARQGLRELLKYSLIVVTSVPLLVVYPFVQKFFVKGVMIGSLKG